MNGNTRESLTELLRRFLDEPAARAVQDDVNAVDRILDAHPAPAPCPRTLAAVKARMAATALRRRRRIRMLHGAIAAAAALIVTALIGRYSAGPAAGPGISLAAIIPTAVWESHDIASEDLDLVYFASQIRQIEAQMEAIEAGGMGTRSNNAVDELEMEIIAIETEFWKG